MLCGHLADDDGVIEAAIAKDPARFPRMTICDRHGKPARSHYQVVIQVAAQNRMTAQLAVNPQLMSAPGFRGQHHPRNRPKIRRAFRG
jgi:predicted anti-sigma-YlaC factor YlaD